MNITTKFFNELTSKELYDLLRLRLEVFVVEQECVYQDLDGKDYKALHILGYKDEMLVVYARCFKPGDYFKQASVGRVVVSKEKRQHNYGHQIMRTALDALKNHFNETNIKLSAQSYLKKFYTNFGFKEVGEEYLEDGIPHIVMIKP